jgi:hypothetical protein
MSKLQDIQFFHAAGHKDVVGEWEALFQHAKLGLQAAICYATSPGIDILSKAAKQLAYGDGFFVASVEYPTNIDALASLHALAKGHVYIHLGYDSPRTNDEVQQDGYALMHSKLMLAVGYQGSKLWVGSHNLTARALSGANLEAGVLITADIGHQVIQDARAHLLQCRNSAERFDPERIEVYKQIQRRRMRGPIEVESLAVLVIHAEAEYGIRNQRTPSTVHLCLKPHQLDKYFAIDREVRLFLHLPGSLVPGRKVDMSQAVGWKGRQTAITRTELHPRNKGVEGRFDTAHFQVFIDDLLKAPRAMPNGSKLDGMTTQVVMRFDGAVQPGSEVYSVRQGTESVRMETEEVKLDNGPIDARLVDSFRPGSLMDKALSFKRITGIGPEVKVQAYMDTLQRQRSLGNAEVYFSYIPVDPKHPIDPYFYITKSVVRLG